MKMLIYRMKDKAKRGIYNVYLVVHRWFGEPDEQLSVDRVELKRIKEVMGGKKMGKTKGKKIESFMRCIFRDSVTIGACSLETPIAIFNIPGTTREYRWRGDKVDKIDVRVGRVYAISAFIRNNNEELLYRVKVFEPSTLIYN